MVENNSVLQIYLEKSFDRVEHAALFGTLAHVGCNHTVLECVKMAYRYCSTYLVVNSTSTEEILIRFSVRQGCPLSPCLFALHLESFCLSINQSMAIRGFRLHATEVKRLAYANNVAFFCADRQSVLKSMPLTSIVCGIIGAAGNWEKSCGV